MPLNVWVLVAAQALALHAAPFLLVLNLFDPAAC
jgi:hypothetical protein